MTKHVIFMVGLSGCGGCVRFTKDTTKEQSAWTRLMADEELSNKFDFYKHMDVEAGSVFYNYAYFYPSIWICTSSTYGSDTMDASLYAVVYDNNGTIKRESNGAIVMNKDATFTYDNVKAWINDRLKENRFSDAGSKVIIKPATSIYYKSGSQGSSSGSISSTGSTTVVSVGSSNSSSASSSPNYLIKAAEEAREIQQTCPETKIVYVNNCSYDDVKQYAPTVGSGTSQYVPRTRHTRWG